MPPNKGVFGLHWVRYGIAGDQKYLLGQFAETYDQLVVNANMVAHMPSAMSQFLSQQLKKPFVIDPQTHAFQHEVDSLLSDSEKSAGSLKRSWRRLVERYGAPLDSVIRVILDKAVEPPDSATNSQIRALLRAIRSSKPAQVKSTESSDIVQDSELITIYPDERYREVFRKEQLTFNYDGVEGFANSFALEEKLPAALERIKKSFLAENAA